MKASLIWIYLLYEISWTSKSLTVGLDVTVDFYVYVRPSTIYSGLVKPVWQTLDFRLLYHCNWNMLRKQLITKCLHIKFEKQWELLVSLSVIENFSINSIKKNAWLISLLDTHYNKMKLDIGKTRNISRFKYSNTTSKGAGQFDQSIRVIMNEVP